jgi:hypothetical protein
MSNEKQQTAVEQLAIALYENGFLQGDGDRIQEIVEIFKEMNKEQTIKTSLFWSHSTVRRKDIEDYYNETYGGNK